MKAKSNPTAPAAKRRQSPKPFVRTPVVDVAPRHELLVNMMTEQRKTPTGFATFYAGTCEEFELVGVPLDLMKGLRKEKHLRVQPGGGAFEQEIDAWLRKRGNTFELELHWGRLGPGPYYCHPLLRLTACRMLQAATYWTGGYPLRGDEGEVPLDRLAKHPEGHLESVPSKRAKFSKEFHRHLLNLSNGLYSEICCGEIAEIEGATELKTTAADNVVSIKTARVKRVAQAESRPI